MDRPLGLISLDQEWRRAWTLEGGVRYVENLEILGTRPVLRLGVLVFNDSTAPVEREILAGGEVIFSDEIRNPGAWDDLVLPLPDVSAGSVTVRLRSDQDFAVGPCELTPKGKGPQNVLMVVIDALRSDHLGCYGYERNTSPNIDRFAQDAVRFTQLVPQSSWTRPSVASILTSTYPAVHGAQDRPDLLRTGLPSLPATLDGLGYETHMLMSNINCLPIWGFGHGFFRVVDLCTDEPSKNGEADAEVVDEAIETLRLVQGRPWYVYVHLMSPHAPLNPPQELIRKFTPKEIAAKRPEDLTSTEFRTLIFAPYDAEIAFVDAQFGRLVDELKRMGEYDNTILALLSDHGEQFWEHGSRGHGYSLFEEELRIPLLLKPGDHAYGGEVRDALLETVDVAPTILELLGARPEPRFMGRSFVQVIHDPALLGRPSAFASLRLGARHERMVKTNQFKLIEEPIVGEMKWFDLVDDPEETGVLAVAPSEGREMIVRARQLAALGAAGLHVLAIDKPGSNTRVAGEVSSMKLGSVYLSHPSHTGQVEATDSGVRWHVRMKRPDDTRPGMRFWRPRQEKENLMHLHIELPPDAEVLLKIEANGETVPADLIRFGATSARRDLSGRPFRALEAAAPPDGEKRDPVAQGFRVYVWYVIPPKTLEDDEIDPATKEALKALGYLDE